TGRASPAPPPAAPPRRGVAPHERPIAKPRLGGAEAGFCARYSARRKLAPRAGTQLAEQTRNRDHDSSDPCGQTRKQQDIAQERRHIAPPLCPPLCMAILPFQRFGLRPMPDSRIVTNCITHAFRTRPGPAERLAGFSGSMAAAIPP